MSEFHTIAKFTYLDYNIKLFLFHKFLQKRIQNLGKLKSVNIADLHIFDFSLSLLFTSFAQNFYST